MIFVSKSEIKRKDFPYADISFVTEDGNVGCNQNPTEPRICHQLVGNGEKIEKHTEGCRVCLSQPIKTN